MIFSEIYGAYFNAVAAILKEAITHPVSDNEMRSIIHQHAFDESIVAIPDALKSGKWQLLLPDGTTPIKNEPSLPLTILQKRWLKSVSLDPRVRLFGDFSCDFPEVEPLFLPEDYILYDKYTDGDDFTDEGYIDRFRLILRAIREQIPLDVEALNRSDHRMRMTLIPDHLEFSEKDDKFRLIGYGDRKGRTVNLGRILSCAISNRQIPPGKSSARNTCTKSVVFDLKDERNALDRALLHFAHLKKEVEQVNAGHYKVTLFYDEDDETEMVIRILMFGPMIRVTAPQGFIDLIKKRLTDQMETGCGQ